MPSAYEVVAKDLGIDSPNKVREYALRPEIPAATACVLRYLADRWQDLLDEQEFNAPKDPEED